MTNSKPDRIINSEEITSGESGVRVAATKPERIGGIDCASAEMLELMPRISP